MLMKLKMNYCSPIVLRVSRDNINYVLNIVIVSTLFVGYVLTTGLEILDPESKAKTIIRILSTLLIISAAIIINRTKVEIIVFSVILLLLFIVNGNQFSINLVYILMMMMSLRHLHNLRLSTALFYASFAAILTHLLALFAGAVSVTTTEIGERIRFTLGFVNANQLALVYLTFVLTAAFYNMQHRTRFSALVLYGSLMIALPMIYVSDSRTSMLSIVLLFLFIYLSKKKLTKRLLAFMGALVPIAASLLSIYLANANSDLLNDLLSNRPYYFSEFLKSASFAGYILGWSSPDEITVDNGYLLLFSSVGAIFFIMMLMVLSKKIYNLNTSVIPLVATMLIASIFESFLLRPEIPLSVMLFAIILGNSQFKRGRAYEHN